ncbi:MAG: alpha/beta hydrolase [Alphaproteobacteria bacterium]|nr:alpha/beta hydrolase [Alphaproteobacteria bacterium]
MNPAGNLLEFETRSGLTYCTHDSVALAGDLYLPKGTGPFPVLVGVHGGGWVQGVRGQFQHWGRYVAARGYALFAITYRLAKPGQKTYPHAVQDVLAAIQFVRGNAKAFNLAHDRVGVFGHSAGGNIGALAALAGRSPPFANGYPQDPHAKESTEVKVFAGVYGVYDVAEMWLKYNIQSPKQNNIELFLGASLPDNRQLYFDASPISHAITANNKVAMHLSVGTEDDLVDRRANTDAFTLALKQAGFFVRTTILQGAPHYWGSDPIEEPESFSGFLAPRLVRFLAERL